MKINLGVKKIIYTYIIQLGILANGQLIVHAFSGTVQF